MTSAAASNFSPAHSESFLPSLCAALTHAALRRVATRTCSHDDARSEAGLAGAPRFGLLTDFMFADCVVNCLKHFFGGVRTFPHCAVLQRVQRASEVAATGLVGHHVLDQTDDITDLDSVRLAERVDCYACVIWVVVDKHDCFLSPSSPGWVVGLIASHVCIFSQAGLIVNTIINYFRGQHDRA